MGKYKTDWQRQKDNERIKWRLKAMAVERAAKPKATGRQVEYVLDIAKRHNLTGDELLATARRYAPSYAQIDGLADLTRVEISQLMKGLQNG